MSGNDISLYGACPLGNLLDGNYAYYQDEDALNTTLNQPCFRDINKRKRHNGRYEWEHDDAA